MSADKRVNEMVVPQGGDSEAFQSLPNYEVSFTSFVWIAAQLGLVLALGVLYRVEIERGFRVLAATTFLGFLIHSWLAPRWRLPFFLLLSLAIIALLVGQDGVWLVIIGLSLIGIGHLSVSWFMRLLLLVIIALGLAAIQTGYLPAPWGSNIIPLLGAIFMFRIILYLYDLKTEQSQASITQRLSYFFLFPNICFPLFPVVDYRTFLSTYYDSQAQTIYQKGVYWILRGTFHLILYRIVYYLLPRADSDLPGILSVYVFMAMTYGLYLRVSGLFHIITGILCLFGFNLPRTNNHYFMASSFNDLWRRINIYWKDFMMTIVFYPTFMRLRSQPMALRLVVATSSVFIVTWFLHSYQWFWLEGVFPVATTDFIFWGVLGVALAANTVLEARKGRRRIPHTGAWSITGAGWLTLRILGVFSFMAVLWTLWDAGSVQAWSYRVLRIRETTPDQWLWFFALLLIVIVGGTALQWLHARGRWLWQVEVFLQRRVHAAALGAVVVLLLGIPIVHASLGKSVTRVVLRAKANTPNRLDLERRERGYYETLTRSYGQSLGEERGAQDLGWIDFRETPAVAFTDDIRVLTLAPNVRMTWKGASLTTNAWGMRDREYHHKKAPEQYRLALLGSSHVMGLGVEDAQTFDNRLEELLNEDDPNRPFEVLNFAVGGYGLIQMLYVAEHVTPLFSPDVVMVVLHPGDDKRTTDRLRAAVLEGREWNNSLLDLSDVFQQARIRFDLPAEEYQRRIAPQSTEVISRTLHEMASTIRDQNATPVFILLPFIKLEFGKNEYAELIRITRDAGAHTIDLTNAFDDHDRNQLGISVWDNHINAVGHELVASMLYRALMDQGILQRPLKASIAEGLEDVER